MARLAHQLQELRASRSYATANKRKASLKAKHSAIPSGVTLLQLRNPGEGAIRKSGINPKHQNRT